MIDFLEGVMDYLGNLIFISCLWQTPMDTFTVGQEIECGEKIEGPLLSSYSEAIPMEGNGGFLKEFLEFKRLAFQVSQVS